MPILDAALAFALTMLLVATVVTQIVRFLQNLAGRRSAEFAKMLREFHENELQPVISREMHRLSAKLDEKLEETVAAGITKTAGELGIEDLVPKGEELAELTQLSTRELEEALKRSLLGAELLKNLGDEAEAVFAELGRRYDALGEKFTASFRAHSRRWATIVALVLAFAVNIDSLFVAQTYLHSEASRNVVIAQSQATIEGYKKLMEGDGESSQLEDMIEESRNQIDRLQDGGFPVGWDHFPHALALGEGEGDVRVEDRHGPMGWLAWLIGILLTAFFAGLGAPFWYDTVTGIARAVQKEPKGS